MNQGIVQQTAAAGSPNWPWSINNMNTPPPSLPHLTPPLFAPPSPDPPHSWTQLVSGLVGEEDMKNLENWEQQLLLNHQHTNSNTSCGGDAKHQNSANSYTNYGPANIELLLAAKSTSNFNCLSPHMLSAASPPKSCITNSTIPNHIFAFSTKSSSDQCNINSTVSNGGVKKARIQASSAQSGIKVRKEKLGDRITALHQLVSPFGKTDTASVLLEAIGYIRFLQRQIEALSLPYLNSGSGNMRRHQPVKRERSCLFPEDPGQLLNENHIKRKAISEQECDEEPKKDLRSRGLCLVPISCTVDVGSENIGADYWGPAFGGNFQ